MQQRDPALLFDVVSPGSFFTIHVNVTAKPFDDAGSAKRCSSHRSR